MCTDKDIQELLPAYLEQGLDHAEQLRIENHLAACHDCCEELSLLRLMAKVTVPDPGTAFWNAMPNKVFQAVQERNAKKKAFDLSGIRDWMTLPRWIGTATALGTVLMISWLVVRPLPINESGAPPQAYTLSYEDTLIADPVAYSVNVAELGRNELETVDTWARIELVSIADEAEQVMAYSHDTTIDIYEELARLNESEAARISETLNRFYQEG